jgi:glycosyltransferase involved in cell wall biosynthesis
MRVLVVTPMLPRPDAASGGPCVMHGQLAALAAHHEVTLATFAGPETAEREAIQRLRAARIEVQAVWRRALRGPRRWIRRGRLARDWLRGCGPLRSLEFREPDMQHLLDGLFADRRFELIQVEDNAMAGYRYQTGAPMVLTEHEVRAGRPVGLRTPRIAQRLRPLLTEAEWRRWQRFQPAVWRRFDRIQVFTPGDAAAMGRMAPGVAARVRVNPFGVELPPDADPAREEDDSVVFVGGFVHPPNMDAALWLGREIMPLLRAHRPGVRLTIVGSQPPEAVRTLDGPDIVVTGWVPAVEPYLERAAVVLAPLRTGGGMRLKVLQAMAHGKAVVTTPLGAEGLAVEGHQPPLTIASEAEELARTASALLVEDDARRQLGARARAFVARHHSWAAYQQRLETLYGELMAERVPVS